MSRPVMSRSSEVRRRSPPAVKKSSMQQRLSRTHAPFHVSIFNWSNDDPKPKRHSAIPPASARANDGQDELFPRVKTTPSPSAARRKWPPQHQSQQQSSQLVKTPLPSAPPHPSTVTPLAIPQEPEIMNGRHGAGGGGEKKFEKTRSTSTFLSSLRRKKRVDESYQQPQSDVAVAPPSISVPSSPSTTRKKWFGLGGRSSSQVPDATIESARVAQPLEGPMALVNGISNGGSVHLSGEQQQPQPLRFAQRIKLYKGLRTGKVPTDLLRQSQSHLVLAEKERERRKKEKAVLFSSKKGYDSPKDNRRREGKGKAFSADAINELDPYYLTEALLNIADEQPIVARSIPKHYVILPSDERKAKERLKRDCLFADKIYEDMLSDSQHVLDMLQSHLSDCIAGVRAKSPTALSSPFSSPPMTPVFGRPQSSSARPPAAKQQHSPLHKVIKSAASVAAISPPRVRISVSGANSETENTPPGSGRFPTRLCDRVGNPLISTSVTTDYRGGLAPSRSPMISVRRELSMADPAALPPLSPTRKLPPGTAAETGGGGSAGSSILRTGQQRTSLPFPVRATIAYNEPTKHDGRYQYFAA